MKKCSTCKTCRYWHSGHQGVWDSELYGTCEFLTAKMAGDHTNDIVPLCEGCVSVRDRVMDFEFVSGETFGCVNHKNKH